MYVRMQDSSFHLCSYGTFNTYSHTVIVYGTFLVILWVGRSKQEWCLAVVSSVELNIDELLQQIFPDLWSHFLLGLF